MNDLAYMHEKFWSGSRLLIGSGPLRDRLQAAMLDHVSHAFDHNEFLPQDLRNRLGDLRRSVTAVPDLEHGAIHASILEMTDAELEHCAGEVLNIAIHVAELNGARALATAPH